MYVGRYPGSQVGRYIIVYPEVRPRLIRRILRYDKRTAGVRSFPLSLGPVSILELFVNSWHLGTALR